MHRPSVTPDSVAVTGSVIGLLSSLTGWLTLKPNRVAAGTSLGPWQAVDWYGAAAILALWLLCLCLSLVPGKTLRAVVLGAAANLILVAVFIFTGLAAERLIAGAAPFARVSLGAGIWLTVAGVYVLVFAVRQKLRDQPLWQNLVSWSGLLVLAILLITGWFDSFSVVQEFLGNKARFVAELGRHIFLFAGSVALGTLIGVPLGIWATRSRRAERPIFFLANVTETIPSLALFGLLIAPLSALSFAFPVLREFGIGGIGATPAVIALVIYSLLPIVQNTYVGLRQLDTAVLDAGLGMGMSRAQVFRRIEVPLAAPFVLEGVRTAAVQAVGNTAVAALIGAGGLGWFIFEGLGQAAADMIILGALPIIVLALVVDAAMRLVVRVATPKGLGGSAE